VTTEDGRARANPREWNGRRGRAHCGGAGWAVLQYVLGFRRLGHEVVLVEPVTELTAASAAYFAEIVRDFGLEGSCAILESGTRVTAGLSYPQVVRAARRCDVLLNISGMLREPQLTEHVPARVYLDLDPAFNQLWHAAHGIDVGLAGHTHFVTVGQAMGDPVCPVPTCGVRWRALRPPVVLEHWPRARGLVHDALTTVGHWRAYGSIEHGGLHYGQKAHALRPLIGLPRRTRTRFVLALAIDPDETRDLEALKANGWERADPSAVASTPCAYRDFVRGSRAEFGLAKSGYAISRCGWFSDRSVCYLASGRPVIAQDTGFDRYLPVGEGLFSFASADDVLAALEELSTAYERHRRAARALAEDLFDSDKVLRELLDSL
jgi:hypothetical protein